MEQEKQKKTFFNNLFDKKEAEKKEIKNSKKYYQTKSTIEQNQKEIDDNYEKNNTYLILAIVALVSGLFIPILPLILAIIILVKTKNHKEEEKPARVISWIIVAMAIIALIIGLMIMLFLIFIY